MIPLQPLKNLLVEGMISIACECVFAGGMLNFKQLPRIPVGAGYKFSQNKQENNESSLAERSEGKGVAATFMAPWVRSGTYPVYFINVHYRPSVDVRYPDEKVKPHHTAIFNHASGGLDLMKYVGGLRSVPRLCRYTQEALTQLGVEIAS